MVCRVELDRARKKSDAFPPLSQLELTFRLVEACPACLLQLFMQLRGDLSFRLKRLGRALTLTLGPVRFSLYEIRVIANSRSLPMVTA